eukprot:s581_g10.t1
MACVAGHLSILSCKARHAPMPCFGAEALVFLGFGEVQQKALNCELRVIFFIGFVGFCVWILAFYSPCKIETKSRKDCGYSGISGGKLEKLKVKVERKKGTTLGLEVSDAKGDLALIQGISGAVQQYNEQLPADSLQRIRVGDAVAKVDGASGKNLADALSRTSEKVVEIDVRRSALPSFLLWLRSSAKPGTIETILTAPGFKRWSYLTTQLGTLGFSCWLLSGYGTASLPVWYFGFSAAVAYKLVRCCHDESVPGGVPHCYRPVEEELAKVVEQAWAASYDFALKTLDQWKSFGQEVTKAVEVSNLTASRQTETSEYELMCVDRQPLLRGAPRGFNTGAVRQQAVPPELYPILLKLLSPNPSERLTIAAFINSEFFMDVNVRAIRFLEQLNEKDETQRVTFLRGLPKLLQDTKSPLCSQRVMRERVLPRLCGPAPRGGRGGRLVS